MRPGYLLRQKASEWVGRNNRSHNPRVGAAPREAPYSMSMNCNYFYYFVFIIRALSLQASVQGGGQGIQLRRNIKQSAVVSEKIFSFCTHTKTRVTCYLRFKSNRQDK
mmetsp:Transcript_5687/g.8435  ORF Transcript_5687/g.8435 Transcript_5687/m.8435 type:complete len:108 (-) Transcript_5687:71-394(-)